MTMRHDARARPFLYVASKEGGLKIYDVRSRPRLTKTIPRSAFRGLEVLNLSQTGFHLYLALGNHFGRATQAPGLAIVDVSVPTRAHVLAVWSDPQLKGGAGAVACVEDTAYLAAMGNGLLIFDVHDKTKPRLMSSVVPDARFPDPGTKRSKVNARGLAVRKERVYLCYDAGGLRIIDAQDRHRPREIGRYSNPVMNGKPRAYNNAVLDGSLLYVAVDYCGVEVLDVSDPAEIEQVSWWNPWHCQESAWNWFRSPGHANELTLDRANRFLFVSTGKSDLHVLDIRQPASPTLTAVYGGPENGIGTWGVSRDEKHIYLSYICTLGIPFRSNWTGVKVLEYDWK